MDTFSRGSFIFNLFIQGKEEIEISFQGWTFHQRMEASAAAD